MIQRMQQYSLSTPAVDCEQVTLLSYVYQLKRIGSVV